MDMVENRHRLNTVIFRRTKADACRPDGSTLFARRWVHTESFVMSEPERDFYNELQVYLMDGFARAKQRGNKGRALGFVMTIFQKIAAPATTPITGIAPPSLRDGNFRSAGVCSTAARPMPAASTMRTEATSGSACTIRR